MDLPITILLENSGTKFIDENLLQKSSSDLHEKLGEYLDQLLSKVQDKQHVVSKSKMSLTQKITSLKLPFVKLLGGLKSLAITDAAVVEEFVSLTQNQILPKFHERIEVAYIKACQEGLSIVQR